MQEVLLRPAHPMAFGFGFGFGPGPMGLVDRRLCSPGLLIPTGDGLIHGGYSPFIPRPWPSPRGDGVFYGGCTPFTPSPVASPRADGLFCGGHTTFTPSPRASPRGATSVSTPSPSSGSRVYDDAAAAATEHRLRMARYALRYQEAANRYQLCVSQLADAAREANALRIGNAELRVANNGLVGRVVMIGGNRASAIALADQLRRLHLGQMQVMPGASVLPMARPAFQAPRVLLPMARPASPAEKHAVLPKSMSIRSTGYLKMSRNRGNGNGKHRVTKPANVGSQRVFVGVDGAKPEEQRGQLVKSTGGLELEVYNQGMFKTELWNMWEQAGACKYADQCQFAHGIAELRPIIRHPRYKTQTCRMITGGALCPFGHRCHFRHPLPLCA